MFTKIDLRWGYNNIRIKEGDKWKAVFLMLEDVFELMVIFFGLTNSPATFQTIINDLFRDIIEAGDITVFIDNVMIEMETKEGHNKIVKEVLRRIVKNDLFVKPEKCVWNVREVGFLGVIIGLDRVKIEEEKIQGVVDWPVLRSIKDIQKFLE